MTTGQVITEKNTQSENATDSTEGVEMVDLILPMLSRFFSKPLLHCGRRATDKKQIRLMATHCREKRYIEKAGSNPNNSHIVLQCHLLNHLLF